MTLAERFEVIQERIAAAARQAGREPEAVTLVVVTKTHPPELVAKVIAAGGYDLGENRVQEAATKIEALRRLLIASSAQPPQPAPHPIWHLIGHLQRNKARLAVELFDLVHSVDSLRLAEALDRAVPADRRLPILLQVNVSGEASKEGFALAGGLANQAGFAALLAEVERIAALPSLAIHGLMTVAPIVAHQDQARPVFRALRELRDELARRVPTARWDELSMGMSDDFEAAIGEGATIVRVGRAIFGERG